MYPEQIGLCFVDVEIVRSRHGYPRSIIIALGGIWGRRYLVLAAAAVAEKGCVFLLEVLIY